MMVLRDDHISSLSVTPGNKTINARPSSSRTVDPTKTIGVGAVRAAVGEGACSTMSAPSGVHVFELSHLVDCLGICPRYFTTNLHEFFESKRVRTIIVVEK